eukprot:3806157-Rhodomonas_salina.1
MGKAVKKSTVVKKLQRMPTDCPLVLQIQATCATHVMPQPQAHVLCAVQFAVGDLAQSLREDAPVRKLQQDAPVGGKDAPVRGGDAPVREAVQAAEEEEYDFEAAAAAEGVCVERESSTVRARYAVSGTENGYAATHSLCGV